MIFPLKRIIILLIVFSLILAPFEKNGFFVAEAAEQTLKDVIAQGTAGTAACIALSAAVRLGKEILGQLGILALPAVPAGSPTFMQNVFEDAKECFRKYARKAIMDWTVNQVTDWIENGGDLGARFTTDWEKDASDAWKAGIGEVVNDSMFAFLCSPFKFQVKMAFMPVKKFTKQISCTLDTITGNINNFYADFNNGGWLAYNAMWEPQNNYFGAVLMINDEATKRATGKQLAVNNDLLAGQGFKSAKKCKTVLKAGDDLKDPWGENLQLTTKTEKVAKGEKPTTMEDDEVLEILNANVTLGVMAKDSRGKYCYSDKLENITPGKLAGDMAKEYVAGDSPLKYLGDENDIGEWVEAIVNAGFNRLMKEGLALMRSKAPSSSGGSSGGSSDGSSDGSSGSSSGGFSENTSNSIRKSIEEIITEIEDNFKVKEFANSTSSEILSKASSSLSYAETTFLNYHAIECYQKGFGPSAEFSAGIAGNINVNATIGEFAAICMRATGRTSLIASTKSDCLTPTISAADINTASSTMHRLSVIKKDGQSLRDLSVNFLNLAEEASSTLDVKKFSKKMSSIITGLSQYINYSPQSPAVGALLTDIDNIDQKTALDNAAAENDKLRIQNDSSTAQLAKCL